MPKKIEKKIPGCPHTYRVFEIKENGQEVPLSKFRVRKRVSVNGKWTTRVSTFAEFAVAKSFSRSKLEIPQESEDSEMTFAEILQKFLHHKEHEERRGPGTIQGYRCRSNHLRFFEAFEMRQVNSKVVDRWADLMLDPEYKALQQHSRRGYEHELVLLGSVLKFYREFYDESFVHPVMERHRKRLKSQSRTDETRYLTSDQEERFLIEIRKWPVIHDLALLQLQTGARVGEAAALEFDAIEFSPGHLFLRQHLHWPRIKNGKTQVLPATKTRTVRTIPLTAECAQMLRDRQARRQSSIVFEDPKRGGWLNYRSVQNVYDNAFKKLGLPHTGSHTLRHTFAVRFLELTKDIYALQKALGHTDLSTTLVYAKYTNESVRRAFQVFNGGASENQMDVPNFVPKIGS